MTMSYESANTRPHLEVREIVVVKVGRRLLNPVLEYCCI